MSRSVTPSYYSREDSNGRSTSTTSFSEQEIEYGSAGYPLRTLTPHSMLIEEPPETVAERWAKLAFALEIPRAEKQQYNAGARRLAQRIRRRNKLTTGQTLELLASFLHSLVKPHTKLDYTETVSFHREAVPDELPQFGLDGGWRIRLPTPKPDVSIGYDADAFSTHHLELQKGIIADQGGMPRDLTHIAQSIPELFWPFFIVEIDSESMLAARNKCAASAATCNNALMMLAGTIKDLRDPDCDEMFLWNLSRAVQSFSLAVYGKTACLLTHNSNGCSPDAVAPLQTYRLDDEKEVETLAAQIQSILAWAENGRLSSIKELLESFDRRVRFRETLELQDPSTKGPMDLPEIEQQKRVQKKGVLKAVLTESLPKWAKAEV